MKLTSKTVGLLLAAALVAASLATDAFATDHSFRSPSHLAEPSESYASCQAHITASQSPQSQRPHPPSSTPVSYHHYCCVTGHNAALLQASQFPQPSCRWTRLTFLSLSMQLTRSTESPESSPIFSIAPPQLLP